MRNVIWLVAMLLLSIPVVTKAHSDKQAQIQVSNVLDGFHKAAAIGDGATYFNLLSDDAVFLGTDASERWSKDEFKKYAMPAFADGEGWLYTMKERHIEFIAQGSVAIFDEIVYNEKYGRCRGTGVLEKTKQGWKIKQYNLTFTVPNGVATQVIKQIKLYEQQPITKEQ
ncbi:nuclear transport factor 2 family protein [Litorilituus lipolyticus]|uniref:DUF4440 domain-containing protein n=1 Tax=Litorilituus lipolyticus TaxID=2491017 RepID=A0A502L4A7_9GAMM|nr:nuclear transport factor 2 family protein [Litorilituus lipolyticus]TPH15137.1 DUF4440 domain-containing protein [Litorilituus lipolyticus]